MCIEKKKRYDFKFKVYNNKKKLFIIYSKLMSNKFFVNCWNILNLRLCKVVIFFYINIRI